MKPPARSIRIPLLRVRTPGQHRRAEPVTIGVPLRRGAATAAADLWLEHAGTRQPLQVRPLDHWPDGSIRWALLDLQLSTSELGADAWQLCLGGDPPPSEPSVTVAVTEREGSLEIDTGLLTLALHRGDRFPLARCENRHGVALGPERSGLFLDLGQGPVDVRIREFHVEETGPLRAQVRVLGALSAGAESEHLHIEARLELFAGLSTVRAAVTLRNTRAARHPGGFWVLGDPGSMHLRAAVLHLSPSAECQTVQFWHEVGGNALTTAPDVRLHQESSGGPHWNSPVHRDRHGRIPVRYKGYRLDHAGGSSHGSRATPTLVLEGPRGECAIAVPEFWQNFPKAIDATAAGASIGLFPAMDDLHELQGGEQKTHRLAFCLGSDGVSTPPLAWIHDPTLVYPSAEWCCETGAVPFLVPEASDPNGAYLRLVNAAIDGPDSFERKREQIDEFGWRNFGDLYADHERKYYKGPPPLVSHYNNQYDAIGGFAVHFLRSLDARWWTLMMELASHVRDIDTYHTTEDKPAYNNGLFWHTYHYTDAGTATHRTYPTEAPDSGGPSSEHNYSSGFLLHYFMTGERESRDAVIAFGQWVIDMDDGNQTPFRWLTRVGTGLASASGSISYHGPGRAPANSILACLNAYRASGDERFRRKADELVRRCIHPLDDVAARNLLDAERRWYYTIFLQVVGSYLQFKDERGEHDEIFGFMRDSLLRYARWMAEHERPFLDRPEELEYPTETWAAQDMRKSEVFLWAALHVGGDERRRFLERARYFFDLSIRTLTGFPTRAATRPLVLMLSNGYRFAWFERSAPALPPPAASASEVYDAPSAFVPQRIVAMRRAVWTAAGLGVAGLIGLAWLATRLFL